MQAKDNQKGGNQTCSDMEEDYIEGDFGHIPP
jgi:hypothetical protein